MTTATEAPVKYETVIGLEVHAQLLTQSKMFCGCPADYNRAEPNSHVCPICMGMPGVLPVINQRAVEYTIMTGLALNCRIPEHSKFDRKNYPYPDLMKGYQISQYDMPLCVDGWVEIGEPGRERRIGLTRVHLEEDTATSKHVDGPDGGYSLIDVNRAGCALMEIVSEPDMRSSEEARQYLVKLRQILRYIGVSNANMEEGNFRCDANVSLRLIGSSTLGAKVEVKNMNSFRSVQRAIEYEVRRQAELLDRGERIPQETRGWVDDDGRTVSQRSKEHAHDYRYFPEPDLPPLELGRELVESLRARLPELPDVRRHRFMAEYALPAYDAELLTESRERADFYEATVSAGKREGAARLAFAKAVSNWTLGELARLQNAATAAAMAASPGSRVHADSRVTPEGLAELVGLVEAKTITQSAAKQVLERMFAGGRGPGEIVAELGLTQISDTSELETTARRVIDANPKPVADYRKGKKEAAKALVGQVMRETRGRANATLAAEIIERLLQEAESA